MKKLFTIIGFIPSIFVAQQVVTSIHTTYQNKVINDTLTKVVVKNITNNFEFTTNIENTQIYLQPNNEYFLVISRDSCITKRIYFNTINCKENETYYIHSKINFENGEKIESGGVFWYDKQYNTFRNK